MYSEIEIDSSGASVNESNNPRTDETASTEQLNYYDDLELNECHPSSKQSKNNNNPISSSPEIDESLLRRWASDKGSGSMVKTKDPTDSLFQQQLDFFNQMSNFLVSQQSHLKGNLELLNDKINDHQLSEVNKVQRRASGAGFKRGYLFSGSARGKVDSKNGAESEVNGKGGGAGRLGADGSSDDIQVCPVCGLEFEFPSTPSTENGSNNDSSALEDHVASHWCSPSIL